MSHDYTTLFNIVGIFLNAVGVVLLFYFAMPYRVRTDGEVRLILEQTDIEAKAAEGRYDICAKLGLVSILAGAVCQAVAAINL